MLRNAELYSIHGIAVNMVNQLAYLDFFLNICFKVYYI